MDKQSTQEAGLESGDHAKPTVLKELVFPGYHAALDAERLVYHDGSQLTVVDLTDNKNLANIQVPGGTELGLDISGNYIIWSDVRNEKRDLGSIGSSDKANADIFLYDIQAGKERQLTFDSSAQVNPKIWGHYAVWMDNASDPLKEYPSEWQIVLCDLNSGETKTITNTPGGNTDPDISNGKVVWEDGRNVKDKVLRAGSNLPENNTDIYLYDIETEQTRAIATGPQKEGRPHLAGNRIVWEGYGEGTNAADVYVYDLDSGKPTRLTNRKVDQSQPVVYGDYIAWMDERRGISTNDVIVNGKKPNSDIFIYDLRAKAETLMTGDEPQIDPLLSDHWLVYETSRQINPELHAVQYR